MITPRPRRDSRFYEAIFGSRARALARVRNLANVKSCSVFLLRARNDANGKYLSLSPSLVSADV